MRYAVESSLDNSKLICRACTRKTEAVVAVRVVRVVVVAVAHLQVVRVVVIASTPDHAVGTAFDTVPVYNLLFSRLLP